jgi:hypothetical protein
VKRILRKYGYPPDQQEKVTITVLEQAEVLCVNSRYPVGVRQQDRPRTPKVTGVNGNKWLPQVYCGGYSAVKRRMLGGLCTAGGPCSVGGTRTRARVALAGKGTTDCVGCI